MTAKPQTTPNNESADLRPEAVAIIGLGALFPGGCPGVAGYWQVIRCGLDTITDIPADHFRTEDYYDPDPKAQDRIYCRRGAFIDGVPFYPLKFGITPKDIEATDTTQLLGLIVAEEALSDAGYPPDTWDHGRTSVILGVSGALKMVVSMGNRLVHPQLRKALEDSGIEPQLRDEVLARFAEQFAPWRESSFPGLLGNVTAGRLANRLNLGGSNMVVDAACASSLAAVSQALLELRSHRADLVVSGGIDTFSDPFMFTCFSKTPALSPSGEVRSFDQNGDGTLLGEGVGVVVLKRLSDAKRDGDRIYAIIRSVGGGSDGRGTAIFAPSAKGQLRAMQAAYRETGWTPNDVELVEAHGTGTVVGDEVELSALLSHFRAPEKNPSLGVSSSSHPTASAFEQSKSDTQSTKIDLSLPAPTSLWCALGTVKSQIGHTKAAAGVAGLIKAALCLHYRTLPPTIKVKEPLSPLTDENCPFYLNDRARPWLSSPLRTRRAAVSSFGFGGSNFHCLLEECRDQHQAAETDLLLLALSAKSQEDLISELNSLLETSSHTVATEQWAGFSQLIQQKTLNFNVKEAFKLTAAGTAEEIYGQLNKTAAAWDHLKDSPPAELPPGVFLTSTEKRSKLVFWCPPDFQLSNSVDFYSDLALSFPIFRQHLDQAEEALHKLGLTSFNLGHLLYPSALAPAGAKTQWQSLLNTPEISAFISVLAPMALGDLLLSFGLKPSYFSAWGRGIIAAMYLSGTLSAFEAYELAASQDASKVTKTLIELFEKNKPLLYGPSSAVKTAAQFQKALEISSRPDIDQKPLHNIVVLGPDNYSPVDHCGQVPVDFFDFSNPNRSLAQILARSASSGFKADLCQWPAPLPPKAPAQGHSVLIGGANIFTPSQAAPPRPPQALQPQIEPGCPSTKLNTAAHLHSLERLESLHNESLALLKNLSRQISTSEDSSSQPANWPGALGANETAAKNMTALFSPETPIPATQPGILGKSNGGRHHSPAEVGPSGFSLETWGQVCQIVAFETGYPTESLSPALDLENDLGLDSIKKVELLSALAERFPHLTASGHDAGQAGTLETLAARCQPPVNASLSSTSPSSSLDQPGPGLVGSGPDSVAAAFGESSPGLIIDAAGLLFAVLAEETGYPADSLSPELDLENDLGLDSIKKVELLSALSEKIPAADPAEFSKAKKLGDLLSTIQQTLGFCPPAAKSEPSNAAGGRLVREVVAAETGYPIETLNLELDLENDLGLDSIKKVEILSILSETAQLSPQDQGQLSKAKTLGDWEDFFTRPRTSPAPSNGSGRSGQAGSQSQPRPPVSAAAAPHFTQAESANPTSQPGQAVPAVSLKLRPTGNSGSCLGRNLLDRALNSPSHHPSLWQVEPEPFSPDGHGACLWPPTGLVRLVGSDALTKGLEKQLQANGYEVERRPWGYDFKKWRDDSRRVRVLFLVWPGPDRNPGLITQALKALNNSGDRLESIVGLSFLGGYFGFPSPGGLPHRLGNSTSGALVGLLKCAAREWPQVAVRALDIPMAVYEVPAKNWLPAILETAAAPGPVELGLPTSTRPFALSLKPYRPSESAEPLLEPGDTVVVTGGGRGVTAAVVLELARLYRPRLVILGRTPLSPPEPDWLSELEGERQIMEALFRLSDQSKAPKELEARAKLILSSRELRRNLNALRQAGAEVEYIAGDFTSSQFIEATARQIRQKFGPIKGFIHGAGILADHPIIGKNHSDFDRVFSTKTQLATLLLEAFEPEPLRLMVFFSSSTARFGRQGQSDYAAGNEVLNKTAWEMAMLHPNCRVLALNWGPWAGGMVNETLAGQFKSQGVGLIGLQEGAEAFVKLIKSPVGEPAEVLVLGHGTCIELLTGDGAPGLPDGGSFR
ncbi:MAG: SDR family NAD(P)-dependent oxidoreductase [Deltaproteobacteria bacterium]|jgi:3-oxoacyl-(acyl-carrier-protein) synthase/NAD(P)-dependent dehydrogenase (short-subunit alcohol dehydrogenase family)/acyl carrier protein|nr:SDR family NAD(P)-dependent oxidoreductase [Deltaproteobacteria bacterium]